MKRLEQAPDWTVVDTEQVLYNQTDDDAIKIINYINDNYYYWDKVKHYKSTTISKPETLWASVKLNRLLNAKRINFGEYKFMYGLTNAIQKGLHEFDLHLGGHLGSKNVIPSDDKRKYLISSIMEEAIASSQIEGAVTTRKKAKEMLRKNTRPKTKSEQMIVNNYNTINHIVDCQDEILTEEKLFTIHKLIVDQTMDDASDEGRYRDNNEVNIIDAVDGEIVHMPPDFVKIPTLIKELLDFFNDKDEEQFTHPIVKGCIIHFMIGFIHPFVDGNGRTARALFYWYLLKNGYWLTEYLSISRLIIKSKGQYAMAFRYTEIDSNDLTYFINYKLKTMQQAYESLTHYIELKIKEKKQALSFQKIKGVNERQAGILKWLYEEPTLIFTVKEIENRLAISNQTSRTDLEGLVNSGFLEMIELNGKTKGFCKSQKFDTLLNNY